FSATPLTGIYSPHSGQTSPHCSTMCVAALNEYNCQPMKTACHLFSAILIFLLLPNVAPASGRTTQDFDAGWLFSKGDFVTAMMPAFDDNRWQPVTLPHDWSSDGPFSADFGSGNGYAPGGIGWYRKHFQLDANQRGASITLEFDGVYDYSQIWI